MNNYYQIEKALKYLADNFRNQPTLKDIAKHVGLSETHFQKIFTQWAGISPKKFLEFANLNYAKEVLNNGGSIEDATYLTGLSATSRLHDLFVNIISMTPAEFKNGGQNLKIYYSSHQSNYGEFFVASTSKGICELMFTDKSQALLDLKNKWPKAEIIDQETEFHRQVETFINHRTENLPKINLHIKGTNFQIQVWKALLSIPEHKLATYAHVADRVNTKGYRAVGSAIGDNPIAYIIPCHRVIKSTGEFGNYRWGKQVKLAMLGKELSEN